MTKPRIHLCESNRMYSEYNTAGVGFKTKLRRAGKVPPTVGHGGLYSCRVDFVVHIFGCVVHDRRGCQS